MPELLIGDWHPLFVHLPVGLTVSYVLLLTAMCSGIFTDSRVLLHLLFAFLCAGFFTVLLFIHPDVKTFSDAATESAYQLHQDSAFAAAVGLLIQAFVHTRLPAGRRGAAVALLTFLPSLAALAWCAWLGTGMVHQGGLKADLPGLLQ